MSVTARFKAASYLLKERPYALEKPIVLQFPVIDICNSQCQMCRIWENRKSDDLTPQELRHGLRDPLFSDVEGVGINGGEPTLRKDLGELAEVLFDTLPKLRSLSLITNAYKVDEVIARISDVGAVTRRHGGALDVMVSLDGVGELHDRIRGKPGNFERAGRVLDFLQASPLVDTIRIGCTITKGNVHGLADLLEWCIARGLYVKFRLGIPHQRLYTQDLLDPYALTRGEKYHVAEFLEGLIANYETSESQRFFYRSLADQLVRGAPRKAGCDWQHRGATLSSKGELMYCAVQSPVLGRIQDGDSERAYFAGAPKLQQILADKCANCHHDYVGIPPKTQYLKQLLLGAADRSGVRGLAARAYHSRELQALRAPRAFATRRAKLQALAANSAARIPSGAAARVLVCGWYGTETLGDKAILGGVLHALRQALGPIEPTLVSLHPYVSEITRTQMPELRDCRIVAVDEGVRQAATMDLVVFGGGPLMAIDELAEMEALFGAARASGVPTLLAGCGVGPLGARWHDRSLASVLALASARVYRDAESRKLAGRLGVQDARDLVAEDPAFTWLALQRGHLPRVAKSRRKILLLGLRDFPQASYARHLAPAEAAQAKLRYERSVVEAMQALGRRNPDLVIRPMPMCTNHFGDDDRWFYRRLFRSTPELSGCLDLSLLGAELSPLEYAAAFRKADAVLAMRFHALVFALGLEVPAVALDYTLGRGKVHALATRFDVPCRSLSRLDPEFLVAEVERMLHGERPAVTPPPLHFETALREALEAGGLRPPLSVR
jgi:polysaccharide pyruvyl transferase WcaK-like protein/MoaA/NifB/PqqE/SkfB family radical SAM enzyme